MKRTVIAAFIVACGGHSHDEKPAAEPHAESFTTWTATHEYFVEHPPFVVGQKSALAAHATQLAGHAAVKSGKMTAILTANSGTAAQTLPAHLRGPASSSPS